MGTEKVADLQATAAYNFVPLGPRLVPAEFVRAQDETAEAQWQELDKAAQQCCFARHVREHGHNSGWLELDITALTPLLIGGAGDNGQFFAPFDPAHPRLPGSSLRGLVRNLVKILACGTMRPGDDFVDKQLYFRVVAGYGNDALKQHYNDLTQAEGDGTQTGFLVQRANGSCYIVPCDGEQINSIPVSGKGLPYIKWQDDESVIAVDGPMKKRQARYRFAEGDFATHYCVPHELLYSYQNDPLHAPGMPDRNKTIDLLEKVKDKGTYRWSYHAPQQLTGDAEAVAVVPCHFVLEDDGQTVRSFGHGPKYRIPYANAISAHVPQPLRQMPEERADLADALFGVADLWRGRVSFEDAQLDGTAKYAAAALPRPQLVPKPTAYQMYLEQGRNKGAATKHWDNPEAHIRGYKFYWHNETKWQHQPGDPVIKDVKEIRPLQPGTRFNGRVWFQDLSDVELGALCAALALGSDGHTAYKLGRGKALGMGSVRIEARLYLQDTVAQYQSFLGTAGALAHVPQAGELATYVKAFEDYRTENLGSSARDFEQKLQALRDIMDFTPAEPGSPQHAHWAQQIATMPIGKDDPAKRFASHVVLPDIRTVVLQARQGKHS